MLQNLRKGTGYFLVAYWIVTLLGILLTVLFAVVFQPPTPQDLGVPVTQAPAYLMTLPYHPLLNLVVWPFFAWFYLRQVTAENRKKEALRLGVFWAAITIVIDLIGWILIPHPWAMAVKEFYVDYQPWITMIYLIILFTPSAVVPFMSLKPATVRHAL
jgi:hypothetical protein